GSLATLARRMLGQEGLDVVGAEPTSVHVGELRVRPRVASAPCAMSGGRRERAWSAACTVPADMAKSRRMVYAITVYGHSCSSSRARGARWVKSKGGVR